MSISERLIETAGIYHREARKCLRARAYLSACIMQVSVLESALLAMCFLYPAQLRRTMIYQKKKFRRRRSKALDFKLHELVKIANELGWFPPRVVTWGKRATLAGFAHEIRKLRNFVHPGVWAVERSGTTKFTKATFEVVYEIYEVANSWLVHHVESNLARRIRVSVGR
jgi:hypothetical protein